MQSAAPTHSNMRYTYSVYTIMFPTLRRYRQLVIIDLQIFKKTLLSCTHIVKLNGEKNDSF